MSVQLSDFKDLYNDGRYFVYEDGEIVIWCSDEPAGKVNCAWLRNGQMALPSDSVFEKPFLEVICLCETLVAEKLVPCKCGKLLKKEEVGGSHFAGYFCKDCWAEYKKKYSRRCGICGSPEYSCCC